MSPLLARKALRGAIVLIVGGISAILANKVAKNSWLVFSATVGGGLVSYLMIWLMPVVSALRNKSRQAHWRSQVYQATPDTVEFVIHSDCDHEVAAVRAEVVEPDGRVVTSDTTVRPQRSRVLASEYTGVGSYPQNFRDAAPLADGRPYLVAWQAQRFTSSRWVEIGRQEFVTPLPDGKVVQPQMR